MKLELYIRGRFYNSIQLTLPEKEAWMDLREWSDFKAFCIAREEYTNWMIEVLKIKYKRAIENQEYHVVKVFESKVGEILDLENEQFNLLVNGLKKAI